MTKNYEMTKEDMDKLLAASVSGPLIMLQCGMPRSAQERVNSVWQTMGDRMGFDHMSVRPTDKGDRFFTATPKEHQSRISPGNKSKTQRRSRV
jgi:hypothetical protein